MINEKWKPVVGFENLYEVSDQGNVKSLQRNVNGIRYGKPYHFTIEERQMALQTDGKGYMRVNLFKDGKQYPKKVHRLVAEAFLGEITDKEIDHINTIKTDNRLTNLRIVTGKENSNNPLSIEHYRNGNKCNNTKSVVCLSNGVIIKTFTSAAEAIRQGYAKNNSGISNCCRGVKNIHNGYEWKYQNNVTQK